MKIVDFLAQLMERSHFQAENDVRHHDDAMRVRHLHEQVCEKHFER